MEAGRTLVGRDSEHVYKEAYAPSRSFLFPMFFVSFVPDL
jgi:hypothetical protein